jgi:hypothetical protein
MLTGTRHVAIASLACTALLGLGGNAFAQTTTPSATSSPTGTSTQETTAPPEPTTSTPQPSTVPSDTSSAPNEYVESVPTATG